ncbi:hypothetical protein RFI_19463, partial [Reticulomyxa filosa]
NNIENEEDNEESKQNEYEDKKGQTKKTSLDALRNEVQCSDEELMNGLKELNALEINGEWKMLDEAYITDCFDDILACILENRFDYKHVDIQQLLQSIDEEEHDPEVVKHCLSFVKKILYPHLPPPPPPPPHFSLPPSPSTIIFFVLLSMNDQTYLALDMNKVCLFVAKKLLATAAPNRRMEKEQFLSEWQASVPYQMHCDLSMLQGYVILQETAKDMFWQWFDAKELSSDPKQRFEQLFQKKDKWTKQELIPYLQLLLHTGESVDKLLLKYTKMTQEKVKDMQNEKITYYTSRNIRKI